MPRQLPERCADAVIAIAGISLFGVLMVLAVLVAADLIGRLA